MTEISKYKSVSALLLYAAFLFGIVLYYFGDLSMFLLMNNFHASMFEAAVEKIVKRFPGECLEVYFIHAEGRRTMLLTSHPGENYGLDT